MVATLVYEKAASTASMTVARLDVKRVGNLAAK
jgi:hypothetical protein